MEHDIEHGDPHGHVGGILLGLLVGAAVGAGLALLLAPKSGRETRNDLAGRARKLHETANESYRQGRERVEQMAMKGRESVEQVAEKGREAYEKARGVAPRAKEDIKQSVGEFVKAGEPRES
jgi:gas vesicle protein